MLIFQDTFKILYSGKSSRSVGTLSYIATCYRHVNIKSNVLHCFNEATDLLRFSTICYVLAAALGILGYATLSEVPNHLPDKDVEQVAAEIVNSCYTSPNCEALRNASTSTKETYTRYDSLKLCVLHHS